MVTPYNVPLILSAVLLRARDCPACDTEVPQLCNEVNAVVNIILILQIRKQRHRAMLDNLSRLHSGRMEPEREEV